MSRSIIMSFNFGGFQARNMIEWACINQANYRKVLEHVANASTQLQETEIRSRVEILEIEKEKFYKEFMPVHGVLCAKCIDMLTAKLPA